MQDPHEILVTLGLMFDTEAQKIFETPPKAFSNILSFELEERKKCNGCGKVRPELFIVLPMVLSSRLAKSQKLPAYLHFCVLSD